MSTIDRAKIRESQPARHRRTKCCMHLATQPVKNYFRETMSTLKVGLYDIQDLFSSIFQDFSRPLMSSVHVFPELFNCISTTPMFSYQHFFKLPRSNFPNYTNSLTVPWLWAFFPDFSQTLAKFADISRNSRKVVTLSHGRRKSTGLTVGLS